jgi:hypothetical protein
MMFLPIILSILTKNGESRAFALFFCIKVSIITEKIKILKNFGYLFGSINSIN